MKAKAMFFANNQSESKYLKHLIAYYGFDNNFLDSSSNSLHAELQSGTPVWISGVIGNALSFNFGQNRVIIPNDDKLSFTDGLSDKKFTVCFFYRRNDTAQRNILNKYNGTNIGSEYRIFITHQGITIDLYSNFTTDYISKRTDIGTVLSNTWHFAAVTYDGTGLNGLKLYHNNILTSTLDTIVGTYDGMPKSNTVCRIGNIYTNASIALPGVELLQIYDTDLSYEELMFLRNNGNGRAFNEL